LYKHLFSYCKLHYLKGSLQLINRVRQRLLVGLDVAPDVAVTLVPGGLAGVMHPFCLSKLAQESMPQNMWGHIYFSLVRQPPIGLGGDPPDGLGGFAP